MSNDDKATTLVIFGASGDLTWRKLVPGLFNNYKKGRLPKCPNIVGLSRTPYTDEEFRQHIREGLEQFSNDTFDPVIWEKFTKKLHYIPGNLKNAEDFTRLKNKLEEYEGESVNRLYYLATSPEFYVMTVKHLGMTGMADQSQGFRRVVVEKPFGFDLQSAHGLNEAIHMVFDEDQVYRIDHYLGKETAQNILYFRYGNTIFEPVWNRQYIDNVQITVTETVDVEHRGEYYDGFGVLRDMFQNHLLQLTALVAMEPPANFNASAIRDERVKVFSSIRPIELVDTVRAQYEGYCETEGVAPGSQTATYAALKLYVDNWRWNGVPFYLRSGKSLHRKSSEIIIEFQRPPHLLFYMSDEMMAVPNTLSICIQPHEGIHIRFQAKEPGTDQEMQSVEMIFHYDDWFEEPLPDAYERLLMDAVEGDPSLFTRSDGIEASWRLIDPIIDGWQSGNGPPLATYKLGSWGPQEADMLLARDDRVWIEGCGGHRRSYIFTDEGS